MGNYRGTTRCSSCYQTGHNRAGCPTLKERVERERANNPDSYFVRNEDAKAAKRKARATGKRICAYCKTHRKTFDSWDWRNMEESEKADSRCMDAKGKDRWGDEVEMGIEIDTLYGTDGERGIGHSIRACKYRKAAIDDRTSEVRCSRVNHLKRMISNGIGPGASVAFAEDTNVYREHSTAGTFVITSVDWPMLGIERENQDLGAYECMVATHVAHLFNPRPPYGATQRVTLPLDVVDKSGHPMDGYRGRYTSRVASLHKQTSEAKVRASIPFGWTDATDDKTQEIILEELMQDVKSRSKKK